MKRIAIILMLLATVAAAKVRPPILDPSTCPYPYDSNVVDVADPVGWLVADVNVSVASGINVWNKRGLSVEVTLQQVIVGAGTTPYITEIPHAIAPNQSQPVPDPNGGYNQGWTWSILPEQEKIYYLLFTASTPSKPNWRTDQRIICVYAYGEDPPILWVQDVPIITDAMIRNAQRLWQVAAKYKPNWMTKPTLVRVAAR